MKKTAKKTLSFALVLCMLMTLIPFGVFADSASGNVAKIGSVNYESVSEALDKAKSGDTVVLIKDAVLSENAVVKAGVMLLIPCMNGDTGYQPSGDGKGYSPDGTATSPSTGANGTKYCELTIPTGVTLTVNGTVLVNAVTGRPAAGHYDQDINGGYGQVKLAGDIVVNGKLDCYGYIIGSGKVTANKGASVGDLYVVRNFRGGTLSSATFAKNVYPINETDCHNIQTTLVIKDGADYVGLVKMYALNTRWYASFAQVGDSNALFDLNDGAYLVKTFENGREVFNFYGGASFKSGKMMIAGSLANTQDFIFSFDGDNDYIFNDGDYHFTERAKFMTGATLTLKNANMFVDKDKLVVLYDKYSDATADGTRYPDRPSAVMNMDANSSLTNNGSFAGIINTESGKIYAGSGAAWTVTSKETYPKNSYSVNVSSIKVNLSINRAGYEWSLDGNKVVFTGKPCTITWLDTDGVTVLKTEQLSYGEIPSYTPTKEATAQYSYTFNGWDTTPVAVTGNASYVSQGFTETVNKYTVTWANDDGTVLETDTGVEYGTTPSYNGATPTKAKDAQYTYSFKGWDTTPVAVTGDVTYTATYTKTVNKYTVTWVNENGTVLETDTGVEYGATPEYNGAAPTKTGNAQYSYSFKGWDKEIAAVTGDVTYKAAYEETVNKYTVTYYDTDGTTVLNIEQVPYGDVPSYVPTKASQAEISYEFLGWTVTPVAVTGEASYTSKGFKQVATKCTVTWANDDGTVLETDKGLDYGATPEYNGATPTKAKDAQYTYTFKGWDKEIAAVTGDVTYTATYKKTVNKYTVTWVNYDGTVLYKAEYEYGQMPVYGGKEPTRGSENGSDYTFSGWNKATQTVTGDATYTAVFEEHRTSILDSLDIFAGSVGKLIDTIRSFFDKVFSIFRFLPC